MKLSEWVRRNANTLVAWSIGDLTVLLRFWRSGIKPVVIIGQPDLGDVESAGCTPLPNIDPHVHGSEQTFHPAGRFPLQPVGNCGKQIPFGILEIGHRSLASSLPTIVDHLLQSFQLRGDHPLDYFVLFHPGADGADIEHLGHDIAPFRTLAWHLLLVFPKDVLQLVGNMP